MTDREKVINGLEICATGTGSCSKCPMQENCKGTSNAAMAAALKLLKAQEAQGWVSVKDKLPENNAVCLTYSPKGKMRVAKAFLPSSRPNSKYDPMECWWSTHGSGGMRFVAVTHWMPLPEPPKEEAYDRNED